MLWQNAIPKAVPRMLPITPTDDPTIRKIPRIERLDAPIVLKIAMFIRSIDFTI